MEGREMGGARRGKEGEEKQIKKWRTECAIELEK